MMRSISNHSAPTLAFKSRLLRVVVYFLGSVLALVLVLNAFRARGGDYVVFWNAAVHLSEFSTIYDFARDGLDCFKYPPWIALLILPLSAFDQVTSGVIWRVFQLICLAYVVNWTVKATGEWFISIFTLVLFWGFWVSNIATGQITIFLLALSLYGFELLKESRDAPSSVRRAFGWVFLFSGLSAKAFQVLALAAVPRTFIRKSSVLLAAFGLFLLSLPALLTYGSPVRMIQAYFETAGSSGLNLGGGMYGLPVLWTRILGLDLLATESRMVGYVPSALMALATIFWIKRAMFPKNFPALFAAGIALATAVHPLSFSVAFVWAYPLAVFALREAFDTHASSRLSKVLAIIGILFLTVLDSKLTSGLLSDRFGPLAIKAIGVFLLSFALATRVRSTPTGP